MYPFSFLDESNTYFDITGDGLRERIGWIKSEDALVAYDKNPMSRICDRYPIKVEYSIIENCISSYAKPLKRSHIINKKEVCICALDKTELEYDYENFKDDTSRFIEIFENKSRECR